MQAMNAAPRGSASPLAPLRRPGSVRQLTEGKAPQFVPRATRAKLSPKLNPPPSSSRGASPRYSWKKEIFKNWWGNWKVCQPEGLSTWKASVSGSGGQGPNRLAGSPQA